MTTPAQERAREIVAEAAKLVSIGVPMGPLQWIEKLVELILAHGLAERRAGAETALINLHSDLNQIKWIGSDEGWESCLRAVRKEIEKRALPLPGDDRDVSRREQRDCGNSFIWEVLSRRT